MLDKVIYDGQDFRELTNREKDIWEKKLPKMLKNNKEYQEMEKQWNDIFHYMVENEILSGHPEWEEYSNKIGEISDKKLMIEIKVFNQLTKTSLIYRDIKGIYGHESQEVLDKCRIPLEEVEFEKRCRSNLSRVKPILPPWYTQLKGN